MENVEFNKLINVLELARFSGMITEVESLTIAFHFGKAVMLEYQLNEWNPKPVPIDHLKGIASILSTPERIEEFIMFYKRNGYDPQMAAANRNK